MQSRDGGHGASPRNGRLSSHLPIRAKRPAPDSRTLPLSRNKTVRPRPGAWSRTLSDRPTLPQRATDHPEQSAERGEHDSQTSPEDGDARVDDEPLHREVEEAGAGVTTARDPALGAHTTRVIERARERNAIAKPHFQSNLSDWMGRLVCCCYHPSCRLIQRQYHSPPVCSRPLQSSPDPRQQH